MAWLEGIMVRTIIMTRICCVRVFIVIVLGTFLELTLVIWLTI